MFTRAGRALDRLLPAQHEIFEMMVAIVALIFVDGHEKLLQTVSI
jgi:hypothetical protein